MHRKPPFALTGLTQQLLKVGKGKTQPRKIVSLRVFRPDDMPQLFCLKAKIRVSGSIRTVQFPVEKKDLLQVLNSPYHQKAAALPVGRDLFLKPSNLRKGFLAAWEKYWPQH